MSRQSLFRNSAVFFSWRQWLPEWAVVWPGTAPAALQSPAPSLGQGQTGAVPVPHRPASVTGAKRTKSIGTLPDSK